jgi:hypothetical protein
VARFACAFRSTGAGSATLPLGSLYATAAVRPRLVEVGVFNTTSTAVAIALVRLSAGTGTQGAAITEVAEDDPTQTVVATAFNTHTVTPTTIGAALRQASLGAAVGSGIIWTFGGGKTPGIIIPNSTSDGIGIIIPAGTGQICDIALTWDE